MNTTTGRSRSDSSSRDALEHLEARHVGQPQVEHHAVAGLLRERGERRRAGVGGDDVDVVVAEQLADAHLLGGVVLDDQQPLAARRRVRLDAGERGVAAPSVVVGLVTNEKAPRARPCWRSSSRVTICTGMWRVPGPA